MKIIALFASLPIMTALTIAADTPVKGVDTASMDTSVSPKEDFYAFANGKWLNSNPIPASESRWGSFNELNDHTNNVLKTILEEVASNTNAAKGSAAQKVGDFYYTAMDSAKLDKEGIAPLKPFLDRIEAIRNTDDFIKVIAQNHMQGIGGLFGFYIMQDLKQSEKHISYLGQGGLGLPDRDYYFKDDEKSKKIREEYVAHIGKMLELTGTNAAAAKTAASKIVTFETELADVSMNSTEQRDLEAQYNKKTIAELKKMAPEVNWDLYFSTLGLKLKDLKDVIVTQPKFFEYVSRALKQHSLADLKIYLRWQVINGTASLLNSVLEKQNFYFHSTVLEGIKEMKPRWKRAVNAVNESVGELLGQLYVKKAFSPEAKKKVNEMVDNLIAAFRSKIERLDWMGAETKQKALVKLASFGRKLGYPDQWKDYSDLEIKRDSYLMNTLRANRFAFKKMTEKLGKPIDRTEWQMLPHQVNAYYTPLLNEVVFPAAIMQPPFFDPMADDAVNYGGIGAVIGHELLHGFDDQGSKFDPKGNFAEWWTAEDRKKFEERTKILEEQFNEYEPEQGLKVNGKLTLGENIADLGGLTMAYEAYQLSLKNKERKAIDGFTPEQRFFLGWAQIWRINIRSEYLRQMLMTDPHSPGPYRVIGPLSNMQAFYNAFKIEKGNKLYRDPETRAIIW